MCSRKISEKVKASAAGTVTKSVGAGTFDTQTSGEECGAKQTTRTACHSSKETLTQMTLPYAMRDIGSAESVLIRAAHGRL